MNAGGEDARIRSHERDIFKLQHGVINTFAFGRLRQFIHSALEPGQTIHNSGQQNQIAVGVDEPIESVDHI